MIAPQVKGWCPGALRPMLSGDGWLVRIRPPGGVLTPRQAAGIAAAAATHGNGILDLSARANLQLRGIREAAHPALIDDLGALGLIDPDIATETLRNLIVTPFRGDAGHLPSPPWGGAGGGGLPGQSLPTGPVPPTGPRPPTPSLPHKGGREAPPSAGSRRDNSLHPPSPPWGGEGGGGQPAGLGCDHPTDRLAATLTAILARLPRLPGKFGFALDTGPNPVLADASADIRLERDVTGRLILRPDGHPFGRLVTDLDADIRALVTWFLASGGMTEGRGRMAPHLARASLPQGFTVPPATPLPRPRPGPHPEGALVAFAFGQIGADTFGALAARGHALRLTPWRMILIAGLPGLPDDPALITRPDDPLLRVAACTGAPGCPQALGPTRGLARTLARTLAGTLARTLAAEAGHPLHVSGCAKGCAHPGPAETTLVATPRGYDIIRGGCASDAPHLTDQPPHLIAAALKARHAP